MEICPVRAIELWPETCVFLFELLFMPVVPTDTNMPPPNYVTGQLQQQQPPNYADGASSQHPRDHGQPGPATSMLPQPPGPGSHLPNNAPEARPQQQKRINSAQVPRPQRQEGIIRYRTRSANVPPAASSRFIAVDEGNSSPRFVRSSMNHIPQNKEILRNCAIPFGAVTQPLATQHPEEAKLSIVNMGESGPVRCNRCKAYINPFVKWLAQGTKFECNFCGFENELPRWYHCNLDEFGHRRDQDTRPEIGCGSVEFEVPPVYSVRPPQLPVFVFLIDVSLRSIATGLLETVLQTIRNSLPTLPGQPRTKVGIMTFDNTLHYYSFHSKSDEPNMVIVGDVTDPYAPIPEQCWLVDIATDSPKVEAVLDLIEQIHGGKKEEVSKLQQAEGRSSTGPKSTAETASSKFQDCACGSAIASAYDALKGIGGRIILVQSSLPTIGTGILAGREQSKLYGTDQERDMWTFQTDNPAAMFYKVRRLDWFVLAVF